MKLIFTLSLILFTSFYVMGSNSDTPPSGQKKIDRKIKVTHYKLIYNNESYWDNFKSKYVNVNSSTTQLAFSFEILKDFPSNTKLEVKMYRSDKKDGPYQYITTYNSYMCDKNDKYWEYLPIIFKNLTKNGNCIQKGKYETNNSGISTFYNLLPENQFRHSYFKTLTTIRASNIIINSAEVDFKSVD